MVRGGGVWLRNTHAITEQIREAGKELSQARGVFRGNSLKQCLDEQFKPGTHLLLFVVPFYVLLLLC